VVQARLVAHLRRVGLPLDDIRTVLAEPALAPSVLAAHLSRLEAGLADARREISIVNRLLEDKEIIMTRFTLPAAEMVRALGEVRYAISTDPELPMLNGIVLDSEPGRLRLVATDRYRLATTTVANPDQVEIQLLLPSTAVDQLLAGDQDGPLDVVVANGTITLSGTRKTVRAEIPEVDFPAYRSWLDLGRQEVPVDAAALRAALDAGTTEDRTRDNDGVAYQVSRLSVTKTGVEVGSSEDPDALVVGVSREFLLQALEGGDQLTLGLDGPIAPLAIRSPDRDGTLSILMPVRLDQPA
jgi:DNA polymerase-3 subunit beta